MKTYLDALIHRLYFEFNDVFSCNSDDSLDRFFVPKDQSLNGTTNPPTRNDQDQSSGSGTNLDKKSSPISSIIDKGLTSWRESKSKMDA
jgi:hypothetical protein